MKQRIFVAGKLMAETESKLQALGAAFYTGDGKITEAELIQGVRFSDALICPLSSPVTAKVLESSKNLKVVANVGAGFDNIAVKRAKELGIAVTNTPEVSTEATAELTLGLILDVMRRISAGDRLLRERPEEFTGWAPTFFLGNGLAGKTLGIIGLGKIGQAVAERANAFGMKLIYSGHKPKEMAKKWNAKFVSEKELFETSDIVTIHASYSEELKHLINHETLKLMKKESFLINAARGPIVCEADLITALKRHEISGAALDVFEFEPKVSAELRQIEQVVLTPHIGNATIETRIKMGEIALDNVQAVLNGLDPLNSVY
ncbi:NAD(P)-dependent oxidoreductase [Listeria sp. PSOL-1]|uniref:NAD(P)-dependent oxidoreductase n=1 Tax=Listeria sp. PSOL-1 TaxID=1844999 RepID=UPI0013D895AC|nr:NAD(P)-dependent oxidoreductase [Listeria sp. PSOL-1]